jgi:hypothetical protein
MGVRDGLDKLVGKVVHLVGYECDKLEPFNQALHLILSQHFHSKRLTEQLMEPMRTTTRRNNLDTLTHLINWHAIHGGTAFYQCLHKFNTFVNVIRLETLEIQRSSGEML